MNIHLKYLITTFSYPKIPFSKKTTSDSDDDTMQEWSWPDPGCFEEYEPEEIMKSTEEIFETLDNVVLDWKKKLEVIVAEGLKTIKKTTKEKKMMMKYLPGDGLIGGEALHHQSDVS